MVKVSSKEKDKSEYRVPTGIPLSIHTDMGANFESKLLGYSKTRTTYAYPQGDGLIERSHRVLNQMLKQYVNTVGRDWDLALPYIAMAYRSTVHDSTGFTPNMLMLGRELNLPIHIVYGTVDYSKISTMEYMCQLLKMMEESFRIVRKNIGHAQKHYKEVYDKRIHGPGYEQGDKVWIYLPFPKPGFPSKFHKPWYGPHIVTKKVNEQTYIVEPTLPLKPGKLKVVHYNKLKPYIEYKGPVRGDESRGSTDGRSSIESMGVTTRQRAMRLPDESEPSSISGGLGGNRGESESGRSKPSSRGESTPDVSRIESSKESSNGESNTNVSQRGSSTQEGNITDLIDFNVFDGEERETGNTVRSGGLSRDDSSRQSTVSSQYQSAVSSVQWSDEHDSRGDIQEESEQSERLGRDNSSRQSSSVQMDQAVQGHMPLSPVVQVVVGPDEDSDDMEEGRRNELGIEVGMEEEAEMDTSVASWWPSSGARSGYSGFSTQPSKEEKDSTVSTQSWWPESDARSGFEGFSSLSESSGWPDSRSMAERDELSQLSGDVRRMLNESLEVNVNSLPTSPEPDRSRPERYTTRYGRKINKPERYGKI